MRNWLRHTVRRRLGIDKWGLDIYRMKKRLGTHEQYLDADISSIEVLADGYIDILDRIERLEGRADTHGKVLIRLIHMVDPEGAAEADAKKPEAAEGSNWGIAESKAA